MKTYLVPTDFSQNAQHAADYAHAMALKSSAKIVLYHAYHLRDANDVVQSNADIDDMLSEETQSQLFLERERLLKNGEVAIEIEYGFGPSVENICTTASKCNAEIIIMGTQGTSGAMDTFIGSITSNVIDNAKIPVLAIPEGFDFDDVTNVTFAWDKGNVSSVAIASLKSFGESFDLPINVLHISDKNVSAQDVGIQTLLKDLGGNGEAIVENESFVDLGFDLFSYAKIDTILCTYLRKHSFIYKLLGKSVTKGVVTKANTPVLVLKEV